VGNDSRQTLLSGWGRYPSVRALEVDGADLKAITDDTVLSRGLGRSYGDASLPAKPGQRVANTRRADSLLWLDSDRARLRGQAGVVLANIALFLRGRGFALPVVPGTAMVTLGGMVAADIHGKNHHVARTFGHHVQSLLLKTADDQLLEISADNEPQLFHATLGGMGLTGHILEVEVNLERIASPWILSEHRRVANFNALLDGLSAASASWPMTVAWCDLTHRGSGFGRGELICGRWATEQEAPQGLPQPGFTVRVPDIAPNVLLNAQTIGVYNNLHFAACPSTPRTNAEHPDSFFHPLDRLDRWNRLYGRRGFIQYQCVLPHDESRLSFHGLADIVRSSDCPLCLCVIKDCGEEGKGLLSFPKPGVSFAMDFPVTAGTQRLVDRLNEHVIAAGGRIYLAKDAMTRREHFLAMEGPRIERFLEVRERWDPDHRLGSLQSQRLFGF
jgi:decaprenylphospho-beta-D-ribofuranose 2-oxidase